MIMTQSENNKKTRNVRCAAVKNQDQQQPRVVTRKYYLLLRIV